MSDVIVITHCAASKRVSPATRCCLRSHSHLSREERVVSWWTSLSTARDRRPASDIYCGAHWSEAMEIGAAAMGSGITSDLWVASAGYGLIHSDQPIVSYSATFNPNTIDSISAHKSGSGWELERRWWRDLARMDLPRNHLAPRTITDLAIRNPRSLMIVSVPPAYLGAMEDDLLLASLTLRPGLLWILCSGDGPIAPRLQACWRPLRKSMCSHLGYPVTTLQARAVKYLVGSTDYCRAAIDDKPVPTVLIPDSV